MTWVLVIHLDCVTIIYGKTAAVLSSLLYTVDVESALGVVRVVAVFFPQLGHLLPVVFGFLSKSIGYCW